MQANRDSFSVVLPTYSFLTAASLVIIAGTITLVIGFVGCCGAIAENKCMMVVYFIFVLIIFGLEVAATALILSYQNDIKTAIKEEMLYSLEYSSDSSVHSQKREGIVRLIDTIQTDLQCCGVNNYTDWYGVGDQSKQVRSSCCVDPFPGCEKSQSFLWRPKGCMEEIEYLFSKNMHYIGIAGLCVAVVQILMMAACIMLFCNMRDRSKY
ncbi:tetraspanin-4 isoform X2 [Ostrea edulis]|nr:tetraspanin-4 isoform X2 [Ostrea edulis]